MFPAGRNPPAKRLTIHLDKRSIDGGRENGAYINERNMVWFQDHLYSANLAPSDFCLFSTIKENWKTFSWPTRKTCSIGCKNLWMTVRAKKWIRYIWIVVTSANRILTVSRGEVSYRSRRRNSLWGYSGFNRHIQLAERCIDRTISESISRESYSGDEQENLSKKDYALSKILLGTSRDKREGGSDLARQSNSVMKSLEFLVLDNHSRFISWKGKIRIRAVFQSFQCTHSRWMEKHSLGQWKMIIYMCTSGIERASTFDVQPF